MPMVNVWFDKKELEEIDKFADKKGNSKADYIRDLFLEAFKKIKKDGN